MKRTWLRAGTFVAALALATPVAYAQGGQGAGTTQPQGQAKTQGTAKASGSTDQAFVKEMFMSNMAEIELGNMAAEKASSADVKSFAQMMVTHHTQANKDLMAVAGDVKQPTELDAKHRAVSQRLSKLSGAEFDRQYMQTMVTSHRETLAKIKPKAGSAGKSAGTGSATGTSGTGATGTGGAAGESVSSVPQYAAKTMPIVQKHLQEAERLQKTVK
jgi:putative membrane protein